MATPTPAQLPYPKSPVLETGAAAGCLIANLFIPGLGTLIAGIVGSKPMIGRAIAQLLLTIVVVGWVWGIVTGVQLLTNATWKTKQSGAAAA